MQRANPNKVAARFITAMTLDTLGVQMARLRRDVRQGGKYSDQIMHRDRQAIWKEVFDRFTSLELQVTSAAEDLGFDELFPTIRKIVGMVDHPLDRHGNLSESLTMVEMALSELMTIVDRIEVAKRQAKERK